MSSIALVLLSAVPAAAEDRTVWEDGGQARFTDIGNVLCAQAYLRTDDGYPVERVTAQLTPEEVDAPIRWAVDLTPGNGNSSCHERTVMENEYYRLTVWVSFTRDGSTVETSFTSGPFRV